MIADATKNAVAGMSVTVVQDLELLIYHQVCWQLKVGVECNNVILWHVNQCCKGVG